MTCAETTLNYKYSNSLIQMNPRARRNRVVVAVLLTVVIITSLYAVSLTLPTGPSFSSLENSIQDLLDINQIPGCATCAIKDGEVIWTGSFGDANIADGITITDDTLFMLGSISKTVTGIVFMQLYQEDLIDLDDDVNDYLPFELVHPSFPEAIITPRMLLSHVSGIHDNWAILGPLQSIGDSPHALEYFTSEYYCEGGVFYNDANFNDAEPGTLFDYTNAGTTLLAYLVERISNTTFEEYCQENIFEPLGMNNTSWFLANLNETDIAVPYRRLGDSFSEISHYGSPVYPCGFIRTSLTQLADFFITIMNGGQLGEVSILDSSMMEMMMTLHYPELVSWYGFCMMYTDGLWGHSGSGPGVAAKMFFDLETNDGAIVLLNIEDGTASLVFSQILEFLEIL